MKVMPVVASAFGFLNVFEMTLQRRAVKICRACMTPTTTASSTTLTERSSGKAWKPRTTVVCLAKDLQDADDGNCEGTFGLTVHGIEDCKKIPQSVAYASKQSL